VYTSFNNFRAESVIVVVIRANLKEPKPRDFLEFPFIIS